MRKLITFLFVLLIATPALAKTKVGNDGSDVYRIGTLFDASAEVGYRLKDQWILRPRLGATFVKTPWFATVGTVVNFQTDHYTSFGLQAEIVHSEVGMWLQATAVVNVKGTPDAFVSAGWSVLGYEHQIRDKAHVFKIKLPISMIYYGLTRSW